MNTVNPSSTRFSANSLDQSRTWEAIVVTDIVASTVTAARFGDWIGIRLMQDLQEFIEPIGEHYGMGCLKSTGDGYLIAYGDQDSAIGAVKAVKASFALLDRLTVRNRDLPPELVINLRTAIHFGEVYALPGDRSGLNVTYTFRLEGIKPPSPIGTFDHLNPITPEDIFSPMPPEEFPKQGYVLCSETVAQILRERNHDISIQFVGLFKLQGIPAWQEVYLLSGQSSQE